MAGQIGTRDFSRVREAIGTRDFSRVREAIGTRDFSRVREATARIRIPRADLAVCLAILLATFAAYASVVRFGFVDIDDPAYVVANLHLRAGLFTVQSLKWVLLSFDPGFWFPVTRLSLLLDYKVFGLHAGAYHAENVILHAMTALLLYGFLRRATGVRWPCAFVAAVFALHPLHVESVVWITERKDVLCAFFWFATLWAWLRYIERPDPGRYAGALALFGLGLMSKPMIVTLPFLLFLLDLWPFRRPLSRKLIVEKIPFVALSCAAMVITVVAQGSANALQAMGDVPTLLRLENALITVAIYIADTFWPARLWFPYAFARSLPAWQVIAAAGGIVAVSALAFRQMHKRPYLTVGWFWFLGTLPPVIGLMQAGDQARADRFMYVPMVGLTLAFTWGIAEVVTRRPGLRLWAAALAVELCIAMALMASFQTQYWRDTEVLYRHAIDMDSQNYLAWNYLGLSLQSANPARAISCFRNGLRIRPDLAYLHNNLGNALCNQGRIEEGIGEYRASLRTNPENAWLHFNLAIALGATGQRNEAVDEIELALRYDPRFAGGYSFPQLAHSYDDLGMMLWETPGHSAEGLRMLEKAAEIDPDSFPAQANLGRVLLTIPGRSADALPHFREALRLNPQSADAHLGIAASLIRIPGRKAEAIAHMEAAQRLQPDLELQRTINQLRLRK
jgi:tetratricopeptide (TPR) repeat protein